MVETTVLYVDMRRSTQLSLKHNRETVAKLYSAFVRAMTRCAKAFGGEVRGIIGDRVMIIFESANCYANAVNTAVLINSVCKYVINKHFTHGEVNFGIGIDHGRMLATKTGIRRHGSAQQSYRSLVWLGRPANVASKLTDHANKAEESVNVTKARVAYSSPLGGLRYENEWPEDVMRQFTYNGNGLMIHSSPAFHSWATFTERLVIRTQTPPILMSECVYMGYKAAQPFAEAILHSWYEALPNPIPDVPGTVYGGDVIYIAFQR
jgi:hypothetical protein